MKRRIALACVCLIVTAATAMAQSPPSVVFPTPIGPGLQLPFGNDDLTVDYGVREFAAGFAFDTWSGTAVSPGAFARYSPSLSNDTGTVTAMLESIDWAFHFEHYHSGPYGPPDNALFSKHEKSGGREDRMFKISHGVDSNSWSVSVGDAVGGWDDVATGLVMDGWVDIDIHFRAATRELDFYWDGTFVGSGETGHGRYDVDFLQFEPHKSGGVLVGSDSFRNFRLGHVGNAPGQTVSFSEVSVDQADLLTFQGQSGVVYRVEANTNPATSVWAAVGLTVVSDGTPQSAFDPGGTVSTSQTYRLRPVP